MTTLIKAFVSGFLATLIFHQGVWALLHLAGAVPAPYNMAATEPLGIPAVFSTAFWGGLWGIALWWFIRAADGARYWVLAIAIGAIAPSAVALAIVFPLKGMPFMAGWAPEKIVGALLLNAAWGFGVALFIKLLSRNIER